MNRDFPYPIWECFLLHSAIVFVSAYLSDIIPPHAPAGFLNHSLSTVIPFIEKFIKWDAHWYTYIAEYGYDNKSIVFFPMMPFLLRHIAALGISYTTAGFVLCNFFTFITFPLLYSTCLLDLSQHQSRRALLAYAVMPTSFFLNSIYTEPLFITFSLACVYYSRMKKWWYGGIFAALATLTRNLGIFLVLLLVYEYWKTYRNTQKLSISLVSLFLPLFALLLFMSYNFTLTSDPIAFIHGQRAWGRHLGLPWDNIVDNIRMVFSKPLYSREGAVLDLVSVVGSLIGLLLLTFSSRITIHRSYLLLGWLWFLVPLCSTSSWLPLYSMSRFILVIFPLYLMISQIPVKLFYCYCFISSVLLSICTMLFINWYWIG